MLVSTADTDRPRLNGRYRLDRILGEGGFGTVYVAYDERRGIDVALKLLSRVGPESVARFKGEFRSAAAVAHPGLVVLHELGFDGDTQLGVGRWYITMDLLEGADFASHLRALGRAHGSAGARSATVTRDTFGDSSVLDSLDDPRGAHIAVAPPVDAPPQQVDHATPLLAILRQIAETLAFLHASGVVHCDLKPSNVVVLSSRRPVLVDFGLAALVSDGPHRGDRGGAGTPHYMAPEQARRRRADGTGADAISPAADMYALGVMMFEAFAHRFPFEGEARAVVHLKQASAAPRLRSVAPRVPLELDALVAALLQIDPVARPSAAVVARALGALEAGLDPDPLATVPREGDRVQTVKVIVGREEPISRAIAATNRGRGHSAVVVMGPAGIGKSAVCAEVMARREPLTLLQARCYEREGGPNEIIDGLGHALLLALDARGLASLPENEHALARLAVVAPSLAQHGRSRGELPRLTPPRVQRALAVDALVSLLTQLGGGQPVCLWLEDLHWLDADGRTLLGDLFLRPAVPELTLLISMRPGDSEGHLLVCELERHARTAVERIVLGPLDQPDALRLVRERLGPTADAESPRILEAVRGAGGNPFLLEQLVDHTQSTELSLSTLSAIVEARVSRLGPAARGILEVLSVAARPVAEPVLMRAVKAAQGDLATFDASAPHVSALYTLSTISLIQRSASTALISLRHAALGGAALENVAPLRVRSIHLAIADALLACALPGSEIEAESVARHLVAAARNARAVAFLDVAAARAMTNLAFERALELDALALELAEPSTRQRAAIAARRGDASSALGRGVLAAGEYRTAARLEPDLRRALDLERQAAEELLRSGRIAEGTRSLDRVLDRLAMSRPRTRVGALAVLAKDTLEARMVGALGAERDLAPATDRLGCAARADAAWTLAMSLGFVDPLVATTFSARHLLEATRAGGPDRRIRALASEAITVAGRGEPGRKKAMALLSRVDALADHLEGHVARSQALSARGVVLALLGSFEQSYKSCSDAAAIFRTTVRDAPWDTATNEHFLVWGAFERARLDQIITRAPALYEDALARGDHYAASGFGTHYANLAWLVSDPSAARKVVAQCRSFWEAERFSLTMYDVAMAEAHLDLWSGDVGPHSLQRIDRVFAELRSSLFFFVEAVCVDAGFLRARLAVASAATASGTTRVTRAVRAARDIAFVRRSRLAIAGPIADLLDAGLRPGWRSGRAERLRCAAAGLDRVGLSMLALLARRTASAVDGSFEVLAIDMRLRAMGVTTPARLAAVFVPGFET